MLENFSLKDILGVIGTITGTIGCTLGILNYLYDRAKIVVNLKWDMEPWGHTHLNKDEFYGCITVANIGRRSIFISHASLKLPGKDEYLVLLEGIKGEKLSEGDKPKFYPIRQVGLEKYSNDWHKIKACVTDSAGKTYYSLPTSKRPSWGKQQSCLFNKVWSFFGKVNRRP